MENRINIGELDTLVTLFAPTPSIGTQGEKIATHTAFRDVFARMDEMFEDVVQYSNLEDEDTKTIVIYKVSQMNVRWRVQISSQQYEITSIDNISRVSPLCRLTLRAID